MPLALHTTIGSVNIIDGREEFDVVVSTEETLVAIEMTLRYTHLAPNHKRAAMAVLEQRFSAQKSQQFSQHPGMSHFRSETKVVNSR